MEHRGAAKAIVCTITIVERIRGIGPVAGRGFYLLGREWTYFHHVFYPSGFTQVSNSQVDTVVDIFFSPHERRASKGKDHDGDACVTRGDWHKHVPRTTRRAFGFHPQISTVDETTIPA